MIWQPVRLMEMSDPFTNDQLRSHEDRLRSLENDYVLARNRDAGDGFDGIREISQAWKENRSTAYLYKKSWADPVARTLALTVLAVIAATWIYLLFF